MLHDTAHLLVNDKLVLEDVKSDDHDKEIIDLFLLENHNDNEGNVDDKCINLIASYGASVESL